ncbi:Gfo/Idh/MocA family protein [Propionibacterium australiense]|uniref:Gfo/Idh/MocA family oxidoreductase n=1 Tax=Propionibacterium australiense TaxID=119981 RepID=A0A383S955_9ACTN|nr:Gfo/Idh/MocA family oxidoreductase [Propionibacterium australiense]RLP09587.1 gfo/Idh/MocA family oxidoreductase [Propionibacterium australiense]RLP12289.1 gfo/Idh/MocA family oxidoreductase [Propionibacterium australiense]SYZ34540.1 Oxidoreductase family, NAD-binding Rossmann fold [Propionibacterium australiense]VEH89684.1 Glucose--fructose oxidoreductase precursor [Propionibacterium australiense]
MTTEKHQLNVALVGYGFIGKAHSHAWRTAPAFFDLPLDVHMSVLCNRNSDRAADGARRFGWQEITTDWRELIARDDIDLIDVCTPGGVHPDIAVAALQAGKHVLCEKPLANGLAEARHMAEAASAAQEQGVFSLVGFAYRRVPAVALAKQMIQEGRIGQVRQIRAAYQQDFIVDPEAPLAWRLQKDKAGSGPLGDLGAHLIDLTHYLAGGTITQTCGSLETFIKRRPLPGSGVGLGGVVAGEGFGEVTVDDAAWFLGRLDNDVLASFEVTRFATGRKNALSIEISGSQGALLWNLEDINVLNFYDNTVPAVEAGFRRILATEPQTPYYAAWWPAGHVIGWEHSFTHEIVDLVEAIAQGTPPAPSFADGLAVQRVLDGVERSATTCNGAWVTL